MRDDEITHINNIKQKKRGSKQAQRGKVKGR